jgi:hypothetical protein
MSFPNKRRCLPVLKTPALPFPYLPLLRWTGALGISLALLLLSGCVHLGSPFEPVPLPDGAPAVREVLASLADNEARLQSFKATGTIMVKIPEMESVQVSRESVLQFSAPKSLYVLGRRYGTRILNLTYDEDAFLLEFPTRREYCFREHAETLGSITSADIVSEMFQPEDWAQINPRLVQMVDYNEEKQQVTLVLWEASPRLRHKRTIRLQGAPWVVLENILYSDEGVPIAKTSKGNYYSQGAIRYPSEIECSFPQEAAWMRFIMRKVDVNTPLDPALFSIAEKLAELQYKQHQAVDLFQGEGPSIGDFSEGSTAEKNEDQP